MSDWITCPKCGAIMYARTTGHLCPTCGYKQKDDVIPDERRMKTIELIDKYEVHQSEEGDYNPPSYIWVDNTGELIRCKDCRYMHIDSSYKSEPPVTAYYCNNFGRRRWVSPSHYCSWAERKEHETV